MKIKYIPEDFLVEEVMKLDLTKTTTNYPIFELTKKGWDSFKIIETIAQALKTKNRFIGFAGNKDKYAITKQYLSFYQMSIGKVENLKIKDVTLKFLGYSRKQINLSDLEGNNFKIIIRDLNKETKIPKNLQLENYYGEQRFGNQEDTYLVGKAIIKKDFKEACKILKLKVKNNDYIGVIRKHQLRLLKFYISSYQSYIWNKTLIEEIKNKKNTFKTEFPIQELIFSNKKIKPFDIELVNFDSENLKSTTKILKEEGVSKNDFIIRQMPELVNSTKPRNAFIEVKNIKSNWSKDEFHKDKLRLELEFFLPKGSYATILIRKLSKIIE